MIYDNLEFHNIRELADLDGYDGKVLLRMPQYLFPHLQEHTVFQYHSIAASEIRFKAERLPVELDISVYSKDAYAAVYFGDHLFESFYLPVGPHTIRIEEQPHLKTFFEYAPCGVFSPHVIRVVFFSSAANISYRGCRSAGALTPPNAEELPKLRYLAYGTSITHGFNATSAVLPYCSQTAYRIGADLSNIGVGGAAFLEEALGQYIADYCDFDVMTAEISVNMLNQGWSAEQFYQAGKKFLTPISEKHPNALKAIISILPFFEDLGVRRPTEISDVKTYRKVAKELCADVGWHFIDGTQLLSFRGLTCDLIHPDDFGMIELGEKLAKELFSLDPIRFDKAHLLL